MSVHVVFVVVSFVLLAAGLLAGASFVLLELFDVDVDDPPGTAGEHTSTPLTWPKNFPCAAHTSGEGGNFFGSVAFDISTSIVICGQLPRSHDLPLEEPARPPLVYPVTEAEFGYVTVKLPGSY